jgi:penicillin-binding protein 2
MVEGEYSKKDEINRRVFFLIIIKFFSFLCLILRIFWLQFIEYKKYDLLSKKNRIRVISINPIRGIIRDCNNNIVASNKYHFRILFDKKIIKNWKSTIDKLFNILQTNIETQRLINQKISDYKGNKPISIFDNITWKELSLIEENSYELEGVYIDKDIIREYRFVPYISHLIGYIGLKKNINSTENQNLKEGIKGVEKAFNVDLRGKFGYKEIEVNAHGKLIKNLKTIESEKGSDITLSIDATLQERIVKILPPNNSIIILSDIKSGKIKSLISKPSFDNKIFTTNISKTEWNKLVNGQDSPLLNRAIQGRYSPGSVFKIVTILAALEAGISENFSYYCTGRSYLGDHFRCWNKSGHGMLDMESAIARSCNHYIYCLAEKIGHQAIIKMAKRLRLDQLSGIEDLGGEVKSFFPTIEWKKEKYNKKWNFADTLNFCLGQGSIQLTPIILNQLISTIANDGNIILASICKHSIPVIISTGIKKDYFTFLKKALFDVVNKPWGTAYKNRISDLNAQMSGKTGTVQVISKSNKHEDLNNADYNKRNHSVFLGYYPASEPKYSITVFVEHGGAGGNLAAEIAKNSFLITQSL